MSRCVPNWATESSLATHKPPPDVVYAKSVDLVPWFDGGVSEGKAVATVALARDAVVPCAVYGKDEVEGVQVAPDSEGGCTRVGSCSGPATWGFSEADDEDDGSVNASSYARVPVAEEGVSASLDMSDTFGGDCSRRVPTMSSCERGLSDESLTTSFFSLDNTFSSPRRSATKNTTRSNENSGSVFRSRKEKEETKTEVKSSKKWTSKSSNKRSRGKSDQSHCQRREGIDQRMKKLQRLVSTSKTQKDKEWVLDEVIEYVKQLQAQLQMMMATMMMMPMIPMMPHMPMGYRQNLALPCLFPAVYMPAPPWNVVSGQLATASPQSHWPMLTVEEAHSRMAYNLMHLQQHPFIGFQHGHFF